MNERIRVPGYKPHRRNALVQKETEVDKFRRWLLQVRQQREVLLALNEIAGTNPDCVIEDQWHRGISSAIYLGYYSNKEQGTGGGSLPYEHGKLANHHLAAGAGRIWRKKTYRDGDGVGNRMEFKSTSSTEIPDICFTDPKTVPLFQDWEDQRSANLWYERLSAIAPLYNEVLRTNPSTIGGPKGIGLYVSQVHEILALKNENLPEPLHFKMLSLRQSPRY